MCSPVTRPCPAHTGVPPEARGDADAGVDGHEPDARAPLHHGAARRRPRHPARERQGAGTRALAYVRASARGVVCACARVGVRVCVVLSVTLEVAKIRYVLELCTVCVVGAPPC
jgi:hypothetical protein